MALKKTPFIISTFKNSVLQNCNDFKTQLQFIYIFIFWERERGGGVQL